MRAVSKRHGSMPTGPSLGSTTLSRRAFLRRTAGAAVALGAGSSLLAACGDDGGGSGKGDNGEVVVMGWTVYLTPEIQKAFRDATGITLKAVAAPDDQSMFTKVKAGGGAQYDVVFANCGWAPTYQQNDLVEVLDLDEIPAAADLWPQFKEDASLPYVVEPNKVLLYPNMWSSTAMMWNTQVDWQPEEPYSWNDLWSAPRGKVMLHGAPEDFIAMAGMALGVPREEIYKLTGSELEGAAKYLKELKPFQISPNSDSVTASAIASGKAYIAFASSLGVAYKANTEFGKGQEVARSVVPTEGALGWVDGPQIVKGAKNRDNALAFIDFFGGNTEIQDYLWDEYFFAQCNKKSTERTLAAGDEGSETAKAIGADRPELASELLMLAPPEDAAAWTQAYDSVIG